MRLPITDRPRTVAALQATVRAVGSSSSPRSPPSSSARAPLATLRAVQQARRDAGLEVSDRLALEVTGAEFVYRAVLNHRGT